MQRLDAQEIFARQLYPLFQLAILRIPPFQFGEASSVMRPWFFRNLVVVNSTAGGHQSLSIGSKRYRPHSSIEAPDRVSQDSCFGVPQFDAIVVSGAASNGQRATVWRES